MCPFIHTISVRYALNNAAATDHWPRGISPSGTRFHSQPVDERPSLPCAPTPSALDAAFIRDRSGARTQCVLRASENPSRERGYRLPGLVGPRPPSSGVAGLSDCRRKTSAPAAPQPDGSHRHTATHLPPRVVVRAVRMNFLGRGARNTARWRQAAVQRHCHGTTPRNPPSARAHVV